MEHLVVVEVDEQRRRRGAEVLEHVDRRAGTRVDAVVLESSSRSLERRSRRGGAGGDELAAAAPRRHLHEQHEGDEEREPAAVGDLRDVGGEEGEVDEQERREDEQGLGRRPAQPVAGDAVEEHRRDHHRAGDGDAVGGGEVARRAEAEHEPDAADHQQPVDERHVHLADVVGRRVADASAAGSRAAPPARSARTPGDQRLRRDHRRHRGEHRQRRDRPVGSQPVERALDRLGSSMSSAAWPK